MATGIEAKIATALLGHLGAFAQAESVSVAWINLNFTPTVGTPYLRPSPLKVPTIQATLGTNGFNRHSGIFQVSVFWPINQGIVAPFELADKVAAHFRRGTTIDVTEGSPAEVVLTVRVETPPTVNTPLGEDAWLHVPVSIAWFADAVNPS